MLYDIAFLLGGSALVEFFASIIGPIFGLVCSMSESLGGILEPVAIFLEQILS